MPPGTCRPSGGRPGLPRLMGPFAQILTRSELIAAFGDDTTAILMYDIDTVPVRDAPGAEYVTVTVTAGKITRMRIIVARAPLRGAPPSRSSRRAPHDQ